MFTAILLFITFVVVYLWLAKKPKNFPPGPPVVPFLGSLPFIKAENFHLSLDGLREKYGGVIGLKFGPVEAVVVCSPPDVEKVLKMEVFQGRPDISCERNRDLRCGIMFTEGSFWERQRRFTLRHLRDFGFGKTSAEGLLLEEADEFFEKVLDKGGQIEGTGLFNICVVNILWAIMAGKRFSYDNKEFYALLQLLQESFRSGNVTGGFFANVPMLEKLFPEISGLNQTIKLENALRAVFKKAFQEHSGSRGGVPRDFIDLYMDEMERQKGQDDSFNHNTLQSICMDLFGAGAESTGNSLSFCLLYLVLYPEWQDRVFRELEEVLGDRKPSLEDRTRLPQAEAFLSEVSRCNTIAPLVVPHKAVQECQLNDYTVPKNAFVMISLWSMLQDKAHWGDPDNFRPDRFLDGQGRYKKDPWLSIFGIGRRICLGESLARSVLFIFFTLLVQRYQFSLPAGHPPPSTLCLPGFTTAPRPFTVVVTRRTMS